MAKLVTFYLRNAPFSFSKLGMRPGFVFSCPGRCTNHNHSASASICRGKTFGICATTDYWCTRQNRPFHVLHKNHFNCEVATFRGLSSSFICYADESGKKKESAEKTDNGAAETSQTSDSKPLTQRQKLARTFAAYGTTGVIFHTCISLASLGTCYMIVSSGIDMVSLMERFGIASKAGMQSTLASGASTFVIAYACHKVFMPVRIFLTVTCTPIIVNRLKRMGILKDKANIKISDS